MHPGDTLLEDAQSPLNSVQLSRSCCSGHGQHQNVKEFSFWSCEPKSASMFETRHNALSLHHTSQTDYQLSSCHWGGPRKRLTDSYIFGGPQPGCPSVPTGRLHRASGCCFGAIATHRLVTCKLESQQGLASQQKITMQKRHTTSTCQCCTVCSTATDKSPFWLPLRIHAEDKTSRTAK